MSFFSDGNLITLSLLLICITPSCEKIGRPLTRLTAHISNYIPTIGLCQEKYPDHQNAIQILCGIIEHKEVKIMFECYEDFADFVGSCISTLREQKNISARDMSLSMGQGAGYVNNLENKNNTPSLKGLYYICEYLKVSPKDFFDNETEAPSLLVELTNECKKLDGKSLQNLIEITKTMKK